MTNAEKYKEVFGFMPDKGNCPADSCEYCPIKCDRPSCVERDWWNSEYKEVQND